MYEAIKTCIYFILCFFKVSLCTLFVVETLMRSTLQATMKCTLHTMLYRRSLELSHLI